MKSVTRKKSSNSEPTTKIEVTRKSEPEIRVLKSATCPSLSGKSNLTYEVGCTTANELQVRIVANTNAGAFSSDWTELKSIRASLDRAPRNETITSDVLRQLYRGGSENMSGFTFSILLHEGLVRRSLKEKEKRRYERVEPETFDATVKALLEGEGASADAKVSKAKGKKAVAAKTPSASTKKKS